MRPRVAVIVLAVAAILSAARPVLAGPEQAPAPVLVVMITVDQMRGDYLDRFGAGLTGGLARLVREGTVFSNAFQDHALTETAPGHSTVLSGRYPASNGILRNSAGVNDSTPLIGVRGPGASPRRFQGTALFDWLCARYPDAKALSVSRKDRAAILPLGRARQPAFWYAGGMFTTSQYYADSLPTWVRAFDEELADWQAPSGGWTTLLDAARYPEPDSQPWEHAGRDVMFPHPVSGPYEHVGLGVADSPYMDSLTLALALRGVAALGLGTGPSPDLLAIGLSSTDAVGHGYGPDSREIHYQVLRLDRWLGTFLDSLGRLRDLRRVVVVLTADHGITSYPEYARVHGHPGAGYANADSVTRLWQARLARDLGPGPWIPYLADALVPLDRPALAARGVNADSIAARMAADYRALPGVRRVDTRASIARADTARDAVARRWQHMLPPDCDVAALLALEPHWVFGPRSGAAQHGQNADDDAHVTLVLWGDGIRHGRVTRRVATVDIAPTLARLLGVTPLEPLAGRPLRDALR